MFIKKNRQKYLCESKQAFTCEIFYKKCLQSEKSVIYKSDS